MKGHIKFKESRNREREKITIPGINYKIERAEGNRKQSRGGRRTI